MFLLQCSFSNAHLRSTSNSVLVKTLSFFLFQHCFWVVCSYLCIHIRLNSPCREEGAFFKQCLVAWQTIGYHKCFSFPPGVATLLQVFMKLFCFSCLTFRCFLLSFLLLHLKYTLKILSPAASSAFSSLLIVLFPLHVLFYTDLTPFNFVLLLFPSLVFVA